MRKIFRLPKKFQQNRKPKTENFQVFSKPKHFPFFRVGFRLSKMIFLPNLYPLLLIGEKHDAGGDPDMTPLNKKRHIAVNTVFPILFESGKLNTIQGKTFYKWFQKSLEYTVWYISTSKRPKELPAIE